jgi:hypothetical protein
MRRQAADYALSRNPSAVYEFVEHYQFYQVEFQARLAVDEAAYRAQVAQARTDNPGLNDRAAQLQESAKRYGTAFEGFGDQFTAAQREKVARDLAGGGDANTTSAETRRQVGEAYQQNVAGMQGHVGRQQIAGGSEPAAARGDPGAARGQVRLGVGRRVPCAQACSRPAPRRADRQRGRRLPPRPARDHPAPVEPVDEREPARARPQPCVHPHRRRPSRRHHDRPGRSVHHDRDRQRVARRRGVGRDPAGLEG